MISKWKYNYTDEEKGMALTILNKNQEINKLVDELEEQERHIKEADIEIERLNNIINEFDKWLENINIGELDDFFIGVKLSELKKAWNDIKGVDKECM